MDFQLSGAGDKTTEKVDQLTAADLDGDGVDEALYVFGYATQGTEERELIVLRIQGDQLANALSVPVGYDDGGYQEDADAASTCEATFEVAPRDASGARKIVVTGRVTQGSAADADAVETCINGVREFRL